MKNKHVVITQTFYEPEMKEQVLELTKNSFPIFQAQKGLLKLQTHNCQGNTHTMSILEWESKQASENCMKSPDFTEINTKWQALLGSGKIKFNYMNYDIIQSFE